MGRRGGQHDLYISVDGTIDPLRASFKAGKSVLAEFGTAAVDLQAEVNKAFQNLSANPVAEARALEQAYDRTFSAIAANAKRALAAPDGAGAVDILNAGAARHAAEAAEAKAAALRIVADAAIKTDTATGGLNAANRVFAVTAEAAARGAQEEAVALRAQAGVLSGVEAQIEGVTGAKKRMVVVTGQAKAGMQQLGFQANDIAVQFAAGTPPAQIFSMQISQVTHALSLMSDGGNKFLSFIGGPWGIGLTVAATVMAPLIAKLLQGNDALDDAIGKLKEDARQTEVTRQAKEAFARTEEGVAAAIRASTEATEKAIKASKSAAEQANIEAQIERNAALAIREKTKARLEDAKALLEAQIARATGPGQSSETAALGLRKRQERVAEIEGQIAKQEADIEAAEERLQFTRIGLAEEEAKRLADPIEQINKLYKDQATTAREAALATGEVTKARARELAIELAAIDAKKKAAIETEQERQRAAKKKGDKAPLTSFLAPVDGPVTGRFGENRGTHRHQGVDYGVPAGTPVRAPAAGVVEFADKRGAYGNVIYINFGGGTEGRYAHLRQFKVKPGDRVEAGDVIGLSGGVPGEPGAGRSTGAHLHEEIRRNGRAVDPRKRSFAADAGALSDIEAKAFEKAEQEAEKEAARQAELADKRELLAIEQELEVARAKGDEAATAALQERLTLKKLEKQFVDLELSAADAKIAAERHIADINAANAEAQARERGEAEAAFELKLAEMRGDHEAVRLAENRAYLAEQTAFWIGKGRSESEAALIAAGQLARIEGVRLDMARKVAAERKADRDADHEMNLARLRGDSDGDIRALERVEEIRRRAGEIANDAGVSADEAMLSAIVEKNAEFAEEDRARMQGEFRDTFKNGVKAALEGDLGDFFEDWWKDRVTRAMEDALNNIADMLFKLFEQAMGQGGQGAGGGGIGGFLSSIGSFFGGGGGGGVSGLGADPGMPSFSQISIPGFAKGGRPPLGRPSLVGEEGMEIFWPDQAGTIISNDKLRAATMPAIPRDVGRSAAMQSELLVRVEGSDDFYVKVDRVTGERIRAEAPDIQARGAAMAHEQQQRRVVRR